MKSNSSWILLKSRVDTILLEAIPSSFKARPDPIYQSISFKLTESNQCCRGSSGLDVSWGRGDGTGKAFQAECFRSVLVLGSFKGLFTLKIKRWHVKWESTIFGKTAQPLSPSHTKYTWALPVRCGATQRGSEGQSSSVFFCAMWPCLSHSSHL